MRMARTLLAVAVLMTAGCDGAVTSVADGDAKPLAKVNLAGGDVVVSGPEGYCIDPETRRTGAARGFAALASCRILTGGEAGPWVEPVLMTVTAGPRGETGALPDPEDLAALIGAPLLGSETREGLVLAHLAEGGAEMLAGGDPRHWRGVFLQGGRMVVLALYAPEDSPMTGAEGARLLHRLKARIAAQSAGGTSGPRPGGVLSRLLGP